MIQFNSPSHFWPWFRVSQPVPSHRHLSNMATFRTLVPAPTLHSARSSCAVAFSSSAVRKEKVLDRARCHNHCRNLRCQSKWAGISVPGSWTWTVGVRWHWWAGITVAFYEKKERKIITTHCTYLCTPYLKAKSTRGQRSDKGFARATWLYSDYSPNLNKSWC